MKKINQILILLVSVLAFASCNVGFQYVSSIGHSPNEVKADYRIYSSIVKDIEMLLLRSFEVQALEFTLSILPKEGFSVMDLEKKTIMGSIGPFEAGELITTPLKLEAGILILRISRRDGNAFASKGSLQIRYQGFDGECLARVELPINKHYADIAFFLPIERTFSVIYPVVIYSGDAINTREVAPPIIVRCLNYEPDN